ncbi:MAG TPA: hypothetical protein PKU70_05080 [Vicinamibacteria bacterium]|nr:hypothetical protein [Vicinamibacteria bacterium]HRB12363.1 hypothetical protein [Vicinamibacteria bacterium]
MLVLFSRCRSRAILIALLTAVLPFGGCTDLNTPASPGEVLQLTISLPSLPADGFSTAQVTAQIDPTTDERYRDIIFTTTLGSFPSGTSTQARSIVVTANSDGRAVVTLRSSNQTGTATISAEIRDGGEVKASQSANIAFQAVASTNVINIELPAAEAPADGASVLPVFARINNDLPQDLREVVFSTTVGTLSIGTGGGASSVQVRAGSDNVATVNLVSPRSPGNGVVSATLNGFSVRRTVVFTQAYPDRAAVSLSGSLRLTATFATKAFLTVRLFRDVGTVSRDTNIAWEAFDNTTGSPVGLFSGVVPTDLQGVATAEWTPGNTPDRGTTTITARVPGTNVFASVVVEIIDPPK